MRGWQPSIAITSVVPERSAPIMMTGRSFSVMAIFPPSDLPCPALLEGPGLLAEPFKKREELLARRFAEARRQVDLLQDGAAAVGGVERQHRGAQPGDARPRQPRRSDERHVDLVAA